jgi:hypothetical protein
MSDPVAPHDLPMSGAIPVGVGLAAVVRIPVPGTNGLAIEFRPRGYVPPTGSTSTVFIQTIDGKRHLRLDYGYNVTTKSVNYHWNQKGTNANFGIEGHTKVVNSGRIAYHAAKYFRYAGRALLVVGVVVDVVSIVQASKPLRRTAQVVTAWAAAGLGCRVVGAGGAVLGTAIEPGGGTIVGGVGGCIIGGIGGYWAGEKISGYLYDWSEDTFFMPLAPASAP